MKMILFFNEKAKVSVLSGGVYVNWSILDMVLWDNCRIIEQMSVFFVSNVQLG